MRSEYRVAAVQPPPTPKEAAAIVAALEATRRKRPVAKVPARSRWRTAGLLGRHVPPGAGIERSLWSYPS